MTKTSCLEKAEVIHSKVLKIDGEYYIRIYLKGDKYDITLQAHDDKHVADELAEQLNSVDAVHYSFVQSAQKEKERAQDAQIAYA